MVTFDLRFNLFLVVALFGCYFLYKAARETLFGKIPSSPAAIGRALAIIVFGQLFSFYILWYISYLLGFVGITLQDPNLSILHGPIGILCIVLAGYISVRTYESTKSMNIKIVCAIGLIPQTIITLFNFNSGISTTIALYLFIPSIIIGGYMSKYLPNKSTNKDK